MTHCWKVGEGGEVSWRAVFFFSRPECVWNSSPMAVAFIRLLIAIRFWEVIFSYHFSLANYWYQDKGFPLFLFSRPLLFQTTPCVNERHSEVRVLRVGGKLGERNSFSFFFFFFLWYVLFFRIDDISIYLTRRAESPRTSRAKIFCFQELNGFAH